MVNAVKLFQTTSWQGCVVTLWPLKMGGFELDGRSALSRMSVISMSPCTGTPATMEPLQNIHLFSKLTAAKNLHSALTQPRRFKSVHLGRPALALHGCSTTICNLLQIWTCIACEMVKRSYAASCTCSGRTRRNAISRQASWKQQT